MPIENDFLSNFVWKEILGDAWDFFSNRNEANAKWDGDLHKVANMYLQGVNTDAGKGLFTVPVEPRSERHIFIFNSSTATTSNITFELQAESTTGGTDGADGTLFQDANALFVTNGVQAGDTIKLSATIEFPDGSAIFTDELPIQSINSETEVVLTAAAATGLAGLTYTVIGPARFAFSIDEDIVSIPQLESAIIINPSIKILEDVDYEVSSGVVNFFTAAPPAETMWAFVFKSNREQIKNNFGEPVNFIRSNGLQYLFGTQGIWYALWNGPAVRRVGVGLQILFGLPFARAGTVQDVIVPVAGDATVSVVDPTRGDALITQSVPPWVSPVVVTGEELIDFSRLSDGVEVEDYITDLELVQQLVVPTRNQFHTWVIKILAPVIQSQVVLSGQLFTFSEVNDFLERFKPEYTDYVIGIDLQMEEGLLINIEKAQMDAVVDMTSRTDFNYWNFLQFPPFLAENTPFTEDPGDPPTLPGFPSNRQYLLDDENMKMFDELTIIDEVATLTETVDDDKNYVNHFDNPGFETENGLTETTYAGSPAGTFPAFDLDAENIGRFDDIVLKEASDGTTVITTA